MQKEIFFTVEEMQIIRICLRNAPCPYDVGKGAKALKILQEKVGEPIPLKGESLPLVECDLTKYDKWTTLD